MKTLNIKNLSEEQVESLKDQIKEYEKENKKPSAEERFAEMVQGLVVKTDPDRYPNSIFFFKGNDLFFRYDAKNNYFWCNYNHVWSVFGSEYGYNYDRISFLITRLVEEHFKYKGVTPISKRSLSWYVVEEHFKYKGVTPDYLIGYHTPDHPVFETYREMVNHYKKQ